MPYSVPPRLNPQSVATSPIETMYSGFGPITYNEESGSSGPSDLSPLLGEDAAGMMQGHPALSPTQFGRAIPEVAEALAVAL